MAWKYGLLLGTSVNGFCEKTVSSAKAAVLTVSIAPIRERERRCFIKNGGKGRKRALKKPLPIRRNIARILTEIL
jgi:hypothetical protein